jgi:hypothetical protein
MQDATKPPRSKDTSLQVPDGASRAAPETSAPAAPPDALEGKTEELGTAAADFPNTSEETRRSSARAAGSAAALQSSRQESTGTREPSADRASSYPDQATPDYELVVRLRSPERNHSSTDSIDVLSKSAERDRPLQARKGGIAGEVVASPVVPPTRTVWYSVPTNHYEEFKRKLTAQGMIEFETATSAKEKEPARKPKDLLSIKVTILPPR